MQAVVHRNVVLALVLKSVGKAASVAITSAVAFLEWIVCAAHRRLRSGGGLGRGEVDTGLEDTVV